MSSNIAQALIGSLGTSAASFIGGERRNQAQQEIADNANTFSAQQFASRYQTTTADMKACASVRQEAN